MSWLDKMPVIPVEGGVPMARLPGYSSPMKAVCRNSTHLYDLNVLQYKLDHYRVNLQSPIGFAHALRVLRLRLGSERWNQSGMVWVAQAWLTGKVTAADREALALALDEVFGV